MRTIKILPLFALLLFTQCRSSSMSVVRSGNYSCQVYSYYHLFKPLEEKDRIKERVTNYVGGRKISEYHMTVSKDTSMVVLYHYDSTGLLDSSFLTRQGVTVTTLYDYDDLGRISRVYDMYLGRVKIKEAHTYKDTVHLINHYFAGSFSSVEHVFENEKGQIFKQAFYSKEGFPMSHTDYVYSASGQLIRMEMYGEKGRIETYEYRYDKQDLLEWEIILNRSGELIDKMKYEYLR